MQRYYYNFILLQSDTNLALVYESLIYYTRIKIKN